MARTIVTGEQYFELSGQLSEINRQLRQPGGYPFSLEGLRGALQNVVEGRFEQTIPSIFGPVNQVILPERSEPFVPNKVIVVGNPTVKISYVDEEIRAIGVEIPPRGPVTIDCRPLVASASFKEINRALPSTPVTLDMIYGLCLLQPKGPNSKKGVFRTDGWGNLFPYTLIGEDPRAVFVGWSFGGWHFDVSSVGDTYEWDEGDPVFSLNS